MVTAVAETDTSLGLHHRRHRAAQSIAHGSARARKNLGAPQSFHRRFRGNGRPFAARWPAVAPQNITLSVWEYGAPTVSASPAPTKEDTQIRLRHHEGLPRSRRIPRRRCWCATPGSHRLRNRRASRMVKREAAHSQNGGTRSSRRRDHEDLLVTAVRREQQSSRRRCPSYLPHRRRLVLKNEVSRARKPMA